MIRKIGVYLMLFCLLAGLPGCSPAPQEAQYFYAMDTLISLRLEGDDGTAFAACRARVEELEQKFSTTLDSSEIARLNREGSALLSEETAAVLQAGLRISEATDQAFCLTLYPATRLWGFTGGTNRVPAAQELEAVRALVDDRGLLLEGTQAALPSGAAVDLGGIAKGYAADCLDALLAEYGITHAFLSLGGNVQVRGGNRDGSPWRVGIADPAGGDYIGVVALRDGAVVTSGGYQRNFTENGETYHHILARGTLRPAESGLKSATVVAENGTLADGLSTALFVMGEERAMAFCRERGDFECILITEDDRVVVSEGLKSSFTLHNTRYQYE